MKNLKHTAIKSKQLYSDKTLFEVTDVTDININLIIPHFKKKDRVVQIQIKDRLLWANQNCYLAKESMPLDWQEEDYWDAIEWIDLAQTKEELKFVKNIFTQYCLPAVKKKLWERLSINQKKKLQEDNDKS